MIRPAHLIQPPRPALGLEGDQHWYDLPDDDLDPEPEERTAPFPVRLAHRLVTWRST